MKKDKRSEVQKLREDYRKGDRVRAVRIDDPYTTIPAGTCGTVEGVDDIGTIHVLWDTGVALGIIPETDAFEKLDGDESK